MKMKMSASESCINRKTTSFKFSLVVTYIFLPSNISRRKVCNNFVSRLLCLFERSTQFDILQVKEAIFLSVDGCSERASELFMPDTS